MLTSAMFPDHSSSDYSDPQKELSDEDIKFTNQVLDRGLLINRKIIKLAPREKLEILISEYLELKEELKGQDAKAFYNNLLEGIDWEPIYKLVQEFIDDPIGNIKAKNTIEEVAV